VKPILTPEEATRLDRDTQALGVSAEDLMERAGRAVARATVDRCGGAYGRRAVVACGKGNNGGDGFVAARHLARAGMRVDVVAVEPEDALREPAATNRRRLDEVGVALRPFSDARLERALARADVAVDAIFGTGFRGVPEDAWAQAIVELNASGVPIVAVDIPSGVNGATGAVEGEAIRAALTVTFGAAKVGVALLPGAERAGDVRVVDIGFPLDLVRADAWLVEAEDVAATLPERDADTHKRASGVLVVVAGSRGMTGAPRLIAAAAARIGVGLVVVAAPTSALLAIQAGLTEAVFEPLPETAGGTVAGVALDAVLARLEAADAVAIGPGLSTHPDTVGLVRAIVGRSPVPIALDADGLNAFADRAGELSSRRSDAVLTPHVGEFGRLSGVKARDLEADRPRHTRALAATTGAVTLLKGTRTVVADPAGQVRVNPTGSPVLATAGSGDVLTGVVGGLLARGVPSLDAASSAAYLHGIAGRLAEVGAGEEIGRASCRERV